MIIVMLALMIIVITLYLASAVKYDEFIKPLDKKEYILKRFLPIGFYIIDGIGYKYKYQYDKFLLNKITEIHGAKNADFYLKIHWSNKILIFIFGLFIIALIGVGSGVDRTYIIFSVLFLISIVILHDRELDKKIRRRRLSIQLDFPDFLNKLALMVNAGLTIRKAWEKIDRENVKDSDFYKEVKFVIIEIKSGKPELKAYEDFARRCRTAEVARFITVVLQNIKKGNAELVSILRILSNESWEIRKNTARKLGEEASTKMVIPLMLIFVAILVILATPAILAISQM
jgi:tight adherence protein C